jgi:glycine hydroxymethyltransferase
VGTPALTTRGMREPEMERIGDMMCRVLENIEDDKTIQDVRRETKALCEAYPVYAEYRRW